MATKYKKVTTRITIEKKSPFKKATKGNGNQNNNKKKCPKCGGTQCCRMKNK